MTSARGLPSSRDDWNRAGITPITRIDDLQRLLTRERIDKATTITVIRDGAQLTRWIMPTDDDRARRAEP